MKITGNYMRRRGVIISLVIVFVMILAGLYYFKDTFGGRIWKMFLMAHSRNLPLKMYGKVIDQYGEPIVGAKVYMVISGGGSFAPGTGLTYYETDTSGIFVVDGKGFELSILRVEHPKLTKALYRTRGGWIKSGAPHLIPADRDGKEYNWRTYDKLEHPFLIHVWRVENYGKVKADRGYLRPVPDGKTFEHAGIIASCSREPKVQGKHWSKQKGSWSITLHAIDGGIQETNDLYLNEAPEMGYQQEITVYMQRGDPDYKVNIDPPRHYYYTAYGGKWYGVITASFNPYILDDVCEVSVEMKYNKNGSRNLAVKPKY